MHTTQSICEAVRSRACSHVIRVQSSACTAATRYREVFFAVQEALFFVSACDRVLEAVGFVELPVIETSTSSCHMIARTSAYIVIRPYFHSIYFSSRRTKSQHLRFMTLSCSERFFSSSKMSFRKFSAVFNIPFSSAFIELY